MAEKKRSNRFWRIFRLVFRWSRIFVWFLLLCIVLSGLYLNTAGLPKFLKEPLLAELKQQGWNVEFQKMRWGWFRGIIIDKAVFSPVKSGMESTRFTARRAEVNADFSRVTDGKVTINSLIIVDGELTMQVETNLPPVVVKDITTQVRLLPKDRLSVDLFQAKFRELTFNLTCDVANISAAKDLAFLVPEKKSTNVHESTVKHWIELAEEVNFADEPEIDVTINGDLREWRKMKAVVKVATAGAQTPWGKFEKARFDATMNSSTNMGNVPTFAFTLSASNLFSSFGSMRALDSSANVIFLEQDADRFQCDFNLSADQFFTRWEKGGISNNVRSATTKAKGTAFISLTNFQPITANSEVQVEKARVRWQQPGSTNSVNGLVNAAELSVHYNVTNQVEASSKDLALWNHFRPFIVNSRLHIGPSSYGSAKAENLYVTADWSWPRIDVMGIEGKACDGEINARASLDVETGEAWVKADSTLDPLKIAPLLSRPGRRFLEKWTWEKPPHAVGEVRVTFPPWAKEKVNWYKEVLPTLQIDALVDIENGSYRQIEANKASGRILYSNMVWNLPGIAVTRPEGPLLLSMHADDRTFTFLWTVEGVIDPNAIRPHLKEEDRPWLDQVKFERAPHIKGTVAGEWGELDKLGVDAVVSAQGFVCRGAQFSSIASTVAFTNMALRLDDLLLTRLDKQIDAEQIVLDLQTKRVYFSDVASTIDPIIVAHVIGEDVVEVLSPYRFAEPPHVLLNGSLGLTTIKTADMHFDIAGKSFQWGYLVADAGSARASWVNQSLTLTNITSLAYEGGRLGGNAFIDFSPKGKATYRLDAAWTNVNASSLVKSLHATNQVEGLLNGNLTVDSADTSGLQTWNGHGHVELTDGLLWEMKVFGIFTPVLDAIVPGLGKSRARSAAGNFMIQNGEAFSDDLEIRASGFRMQYKGTLDYQLNVNARVMAEPLRDTWAVGKVLSTALMPLSKLFEYKITGTVHDPKVKPVYVPKIVMMTLRPFKTLKQLLHSEQDEQEQESIPTTQP